MIMNTTAALVHSEVTRGTSNIRTLFRRLKKVGVRDVDLWDAIRELRAAGKLTYEPCSGTLEVKA